MSRCRFLTPASRSLLLVALMGVLFTLLACSPLVAQTEATSPTWQRAIDPRTWVFPRDHGIHPDFKTEWWYFTGNLFDAQHRRFGYQFTLFRQGVQFTPIQTSSKWAVRDFYFGHFTISDVTADKFHFTERVNRDALGAVKASTDRMDLALGPWSIEQKPGTEEFHLVAKEAETEIDLMAHPLKPLVLEGQAGLSHKGDGVGEASYYYSYPRLTTAGKLRVGATTYTVEGTSWFDHEFSTASLGKDQVGWDWFCIQLDNHEELMLFLIRNPAGVVDSLSKGTWIKADGSSEYLAPGSFTIKKTAEWKSPTSNAVYPAGWQINVPGHHADLTVSPAMADQELHLRKMGTLDYWEGACTIKGSVANAPVGGVGYTELTGYSGSVQPGLKE